jgi:hypothetical protein
VDVAEKVNGSGIGTFFVARSGREGCTGEFAAAQSDHLDEAMKS